MNKLFCLILSLAFSQFSFGQEIIPVNKYGNAIIDTLKYKPVFYSHVIEDTDTLYFAKSYDTAGVLTNVSKTWLKKEKKQKLPIRSISVFYSPSGDTTRVNLVDVVNKTDTLRFYDKGVLFTEVLRKNSLIQSGWEVSYSGDTLPITSLRLTPRINNLEELSPFLNKNLKFPSQARRKGIEGMPYVVLEIDKEGKLKEMAIKNPEFEPLFEAEARRVLSTFPWDFLPQEARDGTYEEGTMILPIGFWMTQKK